MVSGNGICRMIGIAARCPNSCNAQRMAGLRIRDRFRDAHRTSYVRRFISNFRQYRAHLEAVGVHSYPLPEQTPVRQSSVVLTSFAVERHQRRDMTR